MGAAGGGGGGGGSAAGSAALRGPGLRPPHGRIAVLGCPNPLARHPPGHVRTQLMEPTSDLDDNLHDVSGSSRAYLPPPRSSVVELASTRVGVTNGLFLRFPKVYCVGDLALLDRPGVAIVGSRKASAEARRRAQQLARECAKAGIVVISGLAEGVDHAAHQSAIEHGGRTIAVVGTPLDKVYPPRHAQLQEQIYREHLLVSAFPWGDRFVPTNFPERNRIMARLAKATVIIEAGDTSGSLHQAAESVEVGHPVFIARAVVDNPKVTWPGRFIGEGKPLGRILRSASDVIDFVRG